MAMTFDPHPPRVVRPDKAPPLLMTKAQRLEALHRRRHRSAWRSCGSRTSCRSGTPRRSCARCSSDWLRVSEVWVGANFLFGHDRSGNFSLLRTLGQRYGFRAEKIDPVRYKDFVVSSTRIRRLVSEGRDGRGRRAARPPVLHRRHGRRGTAARARASGFPTANLATENELMPPHGVYATTMTIDGVVHAGRDQHRRPADLRRDRAPPSRRTCWATRATCTAAACGWRSCSGCATSAGSTTWTRCGRRSTPTSGAPSGCSAGCRCESSDAHGARSSFTLSLPRDAAVRGDRADAGRAGRAQYAGCDEPRRRGVRRAVGRGRSRAAERHRRATAPSPIVVRRSTGPLEVQRGRRRDADARPLSPRRCFASTTPCRDRKSRSRRCATTPSACTPAGSPSTPRPHRQLPHLRLPRRAAPHAEVPVRLRRARGHELHRRGRQDHRRRAEGRHAAARLHRSVDRRVPRGRGAARARDAGRDAARHRRGEPAGDGRDDPGARAQRPHLPPRRLDLLQDRLAAELRPAGAARSRGHEGRRARRRRRIRQGRRARLRAVEGDQARRADVGLRHRPGPARAGTSSARRWRCGCSASRRSTSTPAAST